MNEGSSNFTVWLQDPIILISITASWEGKGTWRIFFFFFNFIYVFLAALGLRCCTQALSSCGEWGPLLTTVRGPLTSAASPIAEHGLQARGLQQLWRMGLAALQHVWSSRTRAPCPLHWQADSTTAPPGKPQHGGSWTEIFMGQVWERYTSHIPLAWIQSHDHP